jgi:hypothetical protein
MNCLLKKDKKVLFCRIALLTLFGQPLKTHFGQPIIRVFCQVPTAESIPAKGPSLNIHIKCTLQL